MLTIEERITQAKEHVSKLERQRRVEQRKEREIKKKQNQRRNYIIGELVTKYFPETLKFEPGTKDENIVIFEPLEVYLSVLAANKELLQQIIRNATTKVPRSDE